MVGLGTRWIEENRSRRDGGLEVEARVWGGAAAAWRLERDGRLCAAVAAGFGLLRLGRGEGEATDI
jgi:hypothetical protein